MSLLSKIEIMSSPLSQYRKTLGFVSFDRFKDLDKVTH